jgi:hypothetical protein
MENNDFDDEYENDFDLKHFSKYLIHWQWFVLAVYYWFIFIFKIYDTAIQRYTTILVKDENKGYVGTSAFADLEW